MIKIIICPHCGKIYLGIPAKSGKNGIKLRSIDDYLSDLTADFGTSAKEQNAKTTKKENK